MPTIYLFKGTDAKERAITKVNAETVDAIIVETDLIKPELCRQYQIFFIGLLEQKLLLNVQGAINHIRAWDNVAKNFVKPIPVIDPLQKCCSVMLMYNKPDQTVPSGKQIQVWVSIVLTKLRVTHR